MSKPCARRSLNPPIPFNITHATMLQGYVGRACHYTGNNTKGEPIRACQHMQAARKHAALIHVRREAHAAPWAQSLTAQ